MAGNSSMYRQGGLTAVQCQRMRDWHKHTETTAGKLARRFGVSRHVALKVLKGLYTPCDGCCK